MTTIREWFKKTFCLHQWRRCDELIEQFFTGGYYAWQRCAKCGKGDFRRADLSTPEEPGWKEHKKKIDAILKKYS